MDRRSRRKFAEKIIYVTMDYAVDAVKNVAKDLSKELQRKAENYSNAPKNELIETSKDLIVRIDLPGVPREDINIDLTEKKLKIMVGYMESEEGTVIKHRGRNNKVMKEIMLPKRIVVKNSTAGLEDGILTVTMPKKIKKVKYEVPVG